MCSVQIEKREWRKKKKFAANLARRTDGRMHELWWWRLNLPGLRHQLFARVNLGAICFFSWRQLVNPTETWYFSTQCPNSPLFVLQVPYLYWIPFTMAPGHTTCCWRVLCNWRENCSIHTALAAKYATWNTLTARSLIHRPKPPGRTRVVPRVF